MPLSDIFPGFRVCRCNDVTRPVINFINILRAAFAPIFFHQKLQSQTVIREKLRQTHSYKKVACKMFEEIDTCLSFPVKTQSSEGQV